MNQSPYDALVLSIIVIFTCLVVLIMWLMKGNIVLKQTGLEINYLIY